MNFQAAEWYAFHSSIVGMLHATVCLLRFGMPIFSSFFFLCCCCEMKILFLMVRTNAAYTTHSSSQIQIIILVGELVTQPCANDHLLHSQILLYEALCVCVYIAFDHIY